MVVIVNYRAPDLTMRCVDSVLASAGARPRVVVVDNASGDDSAERLERHFRDDASVMVVARTTNDGYTGGNNAGIAIARRIGARFAFVLNPDTEVDVDCLRTLLDEAERDPRVALVAPRIVFGDDPAKIWFDGGHYSLFSGRPKHDGLGELIESRGLRRAPVDITFTTGCAIVVRLDAVADPVFDASLFMYAEDVDLSVRVRQAGDRIRHVPAAVVRHHTGSAAGSTAMRFYLNTRNLIRVAARHARWYHWLTLGPMLAVDVVGRFCAVAMRDGDGAAVVAVLRGARDALTGALDPLSATARRRR